MVSARRRSSIRSVNLASPSPACQGGNRRRVNRVGVTTNRRRLSTTFISKCKGRHPHPAHVRRSSVLGVSRPSFRGVRFAQMGVHARAKGPIGAFWTIMECRPRMKESSRPRAAKARRSTELPAKAFAESLPEAVGGRRRSLQKRNQ